jgi:glycine/D-amino acid oxidase-like deaminating enzyme
MDPADTKAYGRSWYAATMVAAPPRPPLSVDLDVDVCVIGGGLAGLTTAREVARHGWSVALLEAERLATGASGRNTGFVLPGFAAGPDSLIARVGVAPTKDLWALAQSGLDYVRNAIRDDAMPGVFAQDGWLSVSKTDDGDAFMHLVQLLGELGREIEGWPTDRVRAVLRSERYFHAIHYLRALHIHPLNYALGLAAAAERAGARIFEHTPALSIDPAGVRKRIVTPAARLRASHVVLCGNVQIASLMPQIAAALLPITTYVITTGPLGPRLGEAIRYGGAVSDSDLADNHYRIVGGDRLMWSGRATTWPRNPRRYVRALTADIKKTYPQLGEVTVDYAWSGTLGNTIHRMPQIGELGGHVWLASGFGGHGLNTTAMAGNIVARAIVEGDQTWKQFTPFELVWAGGTLGRATAQMYYWTKRARDAMAEHRARAGEMARRNALEMERAPPAKRVRRSTAERDARAPGRASQPQEPRRNEPESIIPSPTDMEVMTQSQTPQTGVVPTKSRNRRKRPEGAKA